MHFANIFLAEEFKGDPCTWYAFGIFTNITETYLFLPFQVHSQFFVRFNDRPVDIMGSDPNMYCYWEEKSNASSSLWRIW